MCETALGKRFCFLLNRIGFEILFCCWNLGCLILRIFLACVPASVAAASHPSAASNAQASRRLCFASVRRLRPGMRSGELLEYRYAIQGSKQTLKETEWGTVSRVELILLPGRARVEQLCCRRDRRSRWRILPFQLQGTALRFHEEIAGDQLSSGPLPLYAGSDATG
jgi:hypothetical protein